MTFEDAINPKTPVPAIPAETATTIEDDVQAGINVITTYDPTQVKELFAWYERYAKGIVVAVGMAATLVLSVAPPAGPVYHYVNLLAGVVTIIGVIAVRNKPSLKVPK